MTITFDKLLKIIKTSDKVIPYNKKVIAKDDDTIILLFHSNDDRHQSLTIIRKLGVNDSKFEKILYKSPLLYGVLIDRW